MQKYVFKHSHSKSGRVDNSELAEESEDGMIPAAKDRTMPQMSRSTEKPRENVRKFLNEIPKLPSHYCRASSSKLYLEPHFRSLADVYKLFTETQTANVASRQVFADEFNKMNIEHRTCQRKISAISVVLSKLGIYQKLITKNT